MTAGALTLAIMLGGAALGADVFPLATRDFSIPIGVRPDRRAAIRELQLWVSEDQGRSWRQEANAGPAQEAFEFHARGDGQVWTSVVVVYTNGRKEPDDLYRAKPAQKILIDTQKPVARFTVAERAGDELSVAWDVQDAALEPASLKLEYRPLDGGFWLALPAQQAANGSGRFRLNTVAPVALRLQVQDQAGNVGEIERQLPASGPAGVAAGPVPVVPQVVQANALNAPPLPTPAAPSPVGLDVPPAPAPVAAVPPPFAPAAVVPPPMPAVAPAVPAPPPPAAPPSEPGLTPIASSATEAVVQRPVFSAPPAAAIPPAPAAPPAASDVQFVNDTLLTLDYEIERQGPSGISKVDVYLTTDDGRTWVKYTDLPRTSLARPDPATPNKLPVTFNLPKTDGVYGVKLVLHSGVSQSVGAPAPGEAPELRVQLDRTKPSANLYPPTADATQANALVLKWDAFDQNFGDAPIRLYWSTRPTGDWQAIGPAGSSALSITAPPASWLPNTGSYTWLLPPNPPLEVYLRIVAEDKAGNSNEAVTRTPIKVDLLKPTGVIRGIVRKR